MTDIRVKICGLSTPPHVEAAVAAGAGYVGFTFFPKSPRNVTLEQAAELAPLVPEGVVKVALTVNADDAQLGALMAAVPIDMLQLHGAEPPARVAEVKARYGVPVMKAIGVAETEDLARIAAYAPVVDQILLDTKPPKGADRPGGNALSFDWSLVTDLEWSVPWMLAGGLTPDNVAQAVRQTGATQVDVSSGVESAPGEKDADLVRAFVENAQSA